METLNLKEIQQEELNILEKAIKFLDKNNIKYYIAYGTLLGAVRHQGFIPWDDDIDLMMFREDYDKLVKILKDDNKISNNLEAIAFELDNSDWPFIKIVNKDIIVETEENCDKNLWIDIFPLDKSFDKKSINKIYKKIIKCLYGIKRYFITKNKIAIPYFKIKKIINLIIKPIKYETIIKKYIKICKNNKAKQNTYVSDNIWNDFNKNYNKVWFKDKKIKFESLEVNAIDGYDDFLKEEYGNYMELPPEDQRVSHNIKAYRRKNIEK